MISQAAVTSGRTGGGGQMSATAREYYLKLDDENIQTR